MNVPCLDHNLAFIRAAADHLNDSQPHLCKNVVLSVSHSGLAAEEAGHLSRDEQLALSDAVSTFSRSTLSSLSDQDGEDVDLALRRMQWIVMNCVDSRVVHSMGEWINCLLGIRKEDRGSSLELSVCELLTLIFRRLAKISWVHGVRKLVSPLASKILQFVTKKLADDGISEESWIAHGQAAVCILRGFAVQNQHVNKATELILNKLTAEDATDPQRLLSSEFLSVLLINAKSKQQWSVAMGQLLFLSHRLLDKLLGEWEIDTTDSKDKTVLSSCAEVATGSFLALEGCNFGRANFAPYLKIFAGVWDAVERLLTIPYREPLPVPCRAIFLVVSRILSVDEHMLQSSFKTTPNSLLIYGHLPALHEAAWGMLGTLIQVARLQMFNLSGSVNWLLKQQLKKHCSRRDAGKQGMGARVRSKMYWAIQQHIQLEGITSVALLETEGVACFNVEFTHILEPRIKDQTTRSSETKKSKKRKAMKLGESDLLAADVELAIGRSQHDPQAETSTEDTNIRDFELVARRECLVLMESFVVAGGASISGSKRQMMEKSVGKVAQALMHDNTLALSAAKLLLASVLSPCEHRPRLLPLATQLFSQGCHHSDPDMRKFSFKAADKIGTLIHPRAVSMGKNYGGLEGTEPLGSFVSNNANLSTGAPNAIDVMHEGADSDIRIMANAGDNVQIGDRVQNARAEEIVNDDNHLTDNQPENMRTAVEHCQQMDEDDADLAVPVGDPVVATGQQLTMELTPVTTPKLSPIAATSLSTFGKALALTGERSTSDFDFKSNTAASINQTCSITESQIEAGELSCQPVGGDELDTPENAECSDSEGPLPEIDSGDSEDDME